MNPRAAINDLHPFQGCPYNLLGSSPHKLIHLHMQLLWRPYRSPNGESGSRTHAPLRTNGFQDRLVMTTSISLQMLFICFQKAFLPLISTARTILAKSRMTVNNFFGKFRGIRRNNTCYSSISSPKSISA